MMKILFVLLILFVWYVIGCLVIILLGEEYWVWVTNAPNRFYSDLAIMLFPIIVFVVFMNKRKEKLS